MKIIEREITTTKSGRPVMVLRPIEKYDRTYQDPDTGKPFKKRSFIFLDKHHDKEVALWEYSEKHNPEGFLQVMTQKTLYLCRLFEIEVPTRKRQFIQMMMSISDTITNGIDDLVKQAPTPAVPEESSIIRVKPVDLMGAIHSGTLH